MDDIVKVLVIMAAFALPLIRQIKKSKTEQDLRSPDHFPLQRRRAAHQNQKMSQKVGGGF